jgi:hypothetical protein
MAERTAGAVDDTLQQDAAERLLEWGFSYEEIATNLGQSEAWVREVHEARHVDDSDAGTIRLRTITPENEE